MVQDESFTNNSMLFKFETWKKILTDQQPKNQKKTIHFLKNKFKIIVITSIILSGFGTLFVAAYYYIPKYF